MQIFDGVKKSIGLAMAGKKNPWGSGSSGGSGGKSNGGGSDGESGGEDSGGEGPRNPWLPGGDKGRRSANIEDIFKNRGPEGPRRSGGGGGAGFKLPERPGGKSWLPLIAAGVVALWLGMTSVHFIQQGEKALVTRLGGKFIGTMDPGTNFTMPYPISQVTVENVQALRRDEVGTKLILTGDQNLVDLSYSVRWNIKDLTLFTYQLDEPVETVQEAAETAMRSSVAEKTLDSVISGEGRADIQQNVQMRMQSILDSYGAGINVEGVEIDKTDPPESVIDAFNDVLAAQQDAERELNRARRYAQQKLALAEGDAAAFNQIYSEYRLAPAVTRRRLYYETMEQVLAQTDKTVIDADGVTPYIPLREVTRSRSGENGITATAPSSNQQGGE